MSQSEKGPYTLSKRELALRKAEVAEEKRNVLSAMLGVSLRDPKQEAEDVEKKRLLDQKKWEAKESKRRIDEVLSTFVAENEIVENITNIAFMCCNIDLTDPNANKDQRLILAGLMKVIEAKLRNGFNVANKKAYQGGLYNPYEFDGKNLEGGLIGFTLNSHTDVLPTIKVNVMQAFYKSKDRAIEVVEDWYDPTEYNLRSEYPDKMTQEDRRHFRAERDRVLAEFQAGTYPEAKGLIDLKKIEGRRMSKRGDIQKIQHSICSKHKRISVIHNELMELMAKTDLTEFSGRMVIFNSPQFIEINRIRSRVNPGIDVAAAQLYDGTIRDMLMWGEIDGFGRRADK